ncbi:hypothetical protein NM688_g3979 [Phlebia brevispora]|uniref:Uncharacterized protein n=1 Tax=Phlebia brevispora TaxID=194682 RepID=A0ACC1T417_9APHY|nr:hypothetical protein NM688_g3979 [Phlebia brevispora]
MEKVFVALLARAVELKVLEVAKAVVDFIYYAQFQCHTTHTLDALKHALKTFHDNKQIFIDLGIREHFNIPKIHSMIHYYEAILQKGALDGYNTELPECLHIEYAKDAYRAGNRRDYIAHMMTWLRRQEAVDQRVAYLKWLEVTERREATARQKSAESDSDSLEILGAAEEDTPPAEGRSDDEDEDLWLGQSGCAYKIAKRCAFPHTTFEQLSMDHCVAGFSLAFYKYIKAEFPRSPFLPASVQSFRVYKQLKIWQPQSPYVSEKAHFDRI